ncbi:MAG TPA: hypothetical protein VFY24_01440, partial [Azospira sp.]|nr:hypothetical protein [Azospira sp.]
MPLFHLTKAILWAALAAAATFAFISRFTPLSVTLVVLVIASVAFWLARHSTQLRTRYLEKE